MLKLLVRKKQPPKPISLKEHYERRHRILIKRICGGFGDTLIVRMMLEDFTTAFPGAEVAFTCPNHFIDLAKFHPFAKAIPLGDIDENQYGVVYDISSACRTHELRHGPRNTSNRSDIWAAHCGVLLTKHNMYLTPQPDALEQCKGVLQYHNKENKPTILLVTQSQHPGLRASEDDFGVGKSIDPDQLVGIVHGLREQGYYVYTAHSEKRAEYDRLGVDQFTSIQTQSWIALVALADYVITIDTAALHIAGGLNKPTVAIFTFTNANPYTRHYSNMELIQGPCPYGFQGCFTTHLHCKKEKKDPFPCQVGINPSDILAAFDRLTKRFPLGMSLSSENIQKNRRIDLLAHTA